VSHDLASMMTTRLRCALLVVFCGYLAGCREGPRLDTVLASALNPSRTYRATVLLRQYRMDGKFDDSPTTYVLLDRNDGSEKYENGQDFKESEIVMKPSRCGTVNLAWLDDGSLKVICEHCGLALSAVGPHADGMGAIRIVYEGFPALSSWEPAAHSH
jgi:hypothetical protein